MATEVVIKDSMQFPSLLESISDSYTNSITRSNVSNQVIVNGFQISSPRTIFSYFIPYLQSTAVEIDFDEFKYAYNAGLFAHDYMGSADLDYLVLELNNVPSNYQFKNLKKIKYIRDMQMVKDIILSNTLKFS